MSEEKCDCGNPECGGVNIGAPAGSIGALLTIAMKGDLNLRAVVIKKTAVEIYDRSATLAQAIGLSPQDFMTVMTTAAAIAIGAHVKPGGLDEVLAMYVNAFKGIAQEHHKKACEQVQDPGDMPAQPAPTSEAQAG